jgi:hypothetical protein
MYRLIFCGLTIDKAKDYLSFTSDDNVKLSKK